MARGLFRKTSFNKMVGAYRSQWKRFWMRLFTFGMYGRKGMGWWKDPKKAWYNWWYHRTSISIPRLLGYRPSRASFFCAMLVASVISIFAAPVDATRAGVKAHKIKAERKARANGTSSGSSRSKSTSNSQTTSTRTGTGSSSYSSSSARTGASEHSSPTVKETDSTSSPRATTNSSTRVSSTNSHSSTPSKSPPRSTTTATRSPRTTSSTPKTTVTYTPPVKEEKVEDEKPAFTFTSTIYQSEPIKPIVPPEPVEVEPDENTPKSKPKHEGDQYIRKRMIIAGSSYCDKDVLQKLQIGVYLDIVAEPDNPHDKDAVMLMFEGQKVGYISKNDKMPFVTCLRLKRKIYGVITDIITEPYPTKYEFETWFDTNRT